MGSDEHRIRTTEARRVRAYVDGFNLYYGLKEAAAAESSAPSWKWLDVEALCQAIVSKAWPDYFLERDAFNAVIVVSNDSDLALPVTLLREQGLPLGVVNPHRKPTPQLWPRDLRAPHFGRRIEVADVAASQLSDPVTDRAGRVLLSRAGNTIRKPPTW